MEKKPALEIPNTPFKLIWFSLQPYKRGFFLVCFIIVLAEIAIGFQAFALKRFIDTAQSYAQGNGESLMTIFMWVIAFPILSFINSLGYRLSGFLLNKIGIETRIIAVRRLFEYLSLHSLSYFNNRFSGALSEKANTVSGNVQRLLQYFVWSILNLVISFLVTLYIFYKSSIGLAVAFACFFVILIPFDIWITRRQKQLSERQAELSSKVKGELVDSITNITAVQQFSRRFFEITRMDSSLNLWRDAVVASGSYREWVLTVNTTLVNLLIAGILVRSFFLWSNGAMTVGSLIMIATLIRGFSYSLTFIGQILNTIMESYGEMQNGLKDIVRPHDITDKPHAKKLEISEGKVTFEGTTFSYEKDPRLIFNKLSFVVKGGQKVGIVGTSGAGKTTLMKLLLRQHDLTNGSILIDDQDIREVTQESLREKVSIVPQEPMLFHRTIRENIMYGKLHASDEEMIEVAKKAQAHDFIEQLPQKYNSLVGERGVKLSVGQRQRIAIARAFLKNAPILILDEATSALDSESEVAVQKALQALMEGKTVFAIAH